MTNDFIMIETEDALKAYCEQIKQAPWLAIDTEFEREKTYYPELALLQVTDGEHPAIIDPLAIEDLDPIMDLFYSNDILKIFHSARQDLEIFFNLKGSVPAPLFDTQLAAPLLGFPEQTGYANLVKGMLGVELSKSHTRTNWKQRPLNEGQLSYAIDDVIYLAQVYEKIVERLQEYNRLDWLDNDFVQMTDSKIYAPDTDQVWRKIRGANRLKGKKLSVLQVIAQWREESARQQNRPRNWLLRDDAIIDLAHQLPSDKAAMMAIKGINERVARKHAEELLELIQTAQQKEPQALDAHKKAKPLSVDQEALVDAMMAIVRLRADENNLNPISLAPRKEIEQLVRNQPSSVLTSWRAHMIGEELQSFLQGQLSFFVADGRLNLIEQGQTLTE